MRSMFRIGLSILMLALSPAFAPTGASSTPDVNDQAPKFTIKGSIAYDAGVALPPESRAIIELRHLPALPKAPAVAEKRIDLTDKKPPVPFEFEVERYKLVGGTSYFVRAAIVSGTKAIWTSEDIKIEVKESSFDVKEIALKPVK